MPMIKLCAKDLLSGDLVELAGDPFADPDGEHSEFEFLLQEVTTVERETEECVVIGFEGFDVVGFPPDHVLTIER